MNVNIWDVTDTIQQLIRSGTQVDPARLANFNVPLTEVANASSTYAADLGMPVRAFLADDANRRCHQNWVSRA